MSQPSRAVYAAPVSQVKGSYDAIVVGSGFGGGIAACRLAEANRSVCVLERGRRFGRDDFPDSPDNLDDFVWTQANPRGLFDVRIMRDVVVITAAGVGGGSLVYANVQLRAPADVFDDPRWPAAITGESSSPGTCAPRTRWSRYDAGGAAVRKVAAFAAAGARAGREATPLPIAVHFGEPREHPFSGAPQEGCQNLARCDIGCPVHAKNTVDITYVARAESHGARSAPPRASSASSRPSGTGGEWSVGFEAWTAAVGIRRGAARSCSPPARSGRRGSCSRTSVGCPKLSPALGTRFSGKRGRAGRRVRPRPSRRQNAQNDFGPVMTSALDYTTERKLILADGGLPPGFHGVLDIARAENVIPAWAGGSFAARPGRASWVGRTRRCARPTCARRNEAGADEPNRMR